MQGSPVTVFKEKCLPHDTTHDQAEKLEPVIGFILWKICSLVPSSGKFASVICKLESSEDLGLRRQKMLILAGGEEAISFSGVARVSCPGLSKYLPSLAHRGTLIKQATKEDSLGRSLSEIRKRMRKGNKR